MNINTIKSLVACAALTASGMANSALITYEFNDGDSLADWHSDRSAPVGFSIINNEIVMEVGDIDPTDTQSSFYDTQGMSLDLGEANYVSIDMYVDTATWGSTGRFGGFWGVGYDSADIISAYPIMEYQNGEAYVWNSVSPGAWTEYTGIFINNDYNTFALELTSAGIEYSINGTTLYTDTTSDVDYLGSLILNAQWTGTDYSVRYDNLTYGSVDVPAPAALTLIALGLFGITRRQLKK
jgi:hypothetical protein